VLCAFYVNYIVTKRARARRLRRDAKDVATMRDVMSGTPFDMSAQKMALVTYFGSRMGCLVSFSRKYPKVHPFYSASHAKVHQSASFVATLIATHSVKPRLCY
jgi:hypothetical protein